MLTYLAHKVDGSGAVSGVDVNGSMSLDPGTAKFCSKFLELLGQNDEDEEEGESVGMDGCLESADDGQSVMQRILASDPKNASNLLILSPACTLDIHCGPLAATTQPHIPTASPSSSTPFSIRDSRCRNVWARLQSPLTTGFLMAVQVGVY